MEPESWGELLRKSAFADIPDVCRFIQWFHHQEALSHWDHTRYDQARAIIAALPSTPIAWPETQQTAGGR
jgi:hypothetical protein